MEITAYDTDPKVACMIVDSMIRYFNIKARQLQREKSEEVMIIHRDQMMRTKVQMDSMEAMLKDLRQRYGILDYDKQSQEVIRGLFWNLASGNNKGTVEAKEMIGNLKDIGGMFHETTEHLWRTRGTYNDLKIQYENDYRDVNKILTYTNVVTKPQVADKKAYPIRWLIVVVTVVSSLLLAFILLVIIEARKYVLSSKNE
jgi:capsule polysaccharide export protein KpsE/RkpR